MVEHPLKISSTSFSIIQPENTLRDSVIASVYKIWSTLSTVDKPKYRNAHVRHVYYYRFAIIARPCSVFDEFMGRDCLQVTTADLLKGRHVYQ